MGKIIIHEETTTCPISLAGKFAGLCWGADTSSAEKNYKRGLECFQSGHDRTMEYPQVYFTVDGYSARTIRQLYTHIGGAPTRLQSSTRYIEYGDFDYVIPPSIESDPDACDRYEWAMYQISEAYKDLEACGAPREDIALVLPLGMTSKAVIRTNLRQLIDMAHSRLCSRAYWEFRQLMHDLMDALSQYSEEWAYLVENYFKPKCEVTGFCTEAKCCGRKPRKEQEKKEEEKAMNTFAKALAQVFNDFLS